MKEEGIGEKPLIAAIDASFLFQSGKSTDGLGHFWNGAAARSEKGLEVSTVAVVDVKAKTAYALSSQQTMPDGGNRVEQYCNQVKPLQSKFDDLNIKYIATDGYYTKKQFLDAMESQGL